MTKAVFSIYGWFAILFWAPVMFTLIGDGDLFIASDAWKAWWPGTAITCATIGLVVIAAFHAVFVELPGRAGSLSKDGRLLLRVATGFMAIAMPIWGLSLTNGIILTFMDEPVLEFVEMPGKVTGYRLTRHSRHWLIVETEHHRRRFKISAVQAANIPPNGTPVRLLGHRTWIGDTYDRLDLGVAPN